MPLVAGIDSSTQSCKVVVRDAESGATVRTGRASHPDGTEVDPNAWLSACSAAITDAGGLLDVEAIGVGGQQHGLVTIDAGHQPVRPALLWNDTRSAEAAAALVHELGAQAWAQRVGSVPVAAFTVSKLRWLAENEPDSLAKTQAVCLPHDWLTWHLTGGDFGALVTDRGDASGTGYWSASDQAYASELLELAAGRSDFALPRVLGPVEAAGLSDGSNPRIAEGIVVSAGTGDNMAAALALGASPGDIIVSVGTSGVVSVVTEHPVADATGQVAGFADATGNYLPLVCTLNAGLVLDAFRRLLDVEFRDFDSLARAGQAIDSPGPMLLPYLAGERTPNRPNATGVLADLTVQNLNRPQLAASAIDSIACSLADGFGAIADLGITANRVLLVGGGAQLTSLQQALANVLSMPVTVPATGEYVAEGAAVQAQWARSGTRPVWLGAEAQIIYPESDGITLDRYHRLRDQTGPDAWPRT